jgi:hypothetical protein
MTTTTFRQYIADQAFWVEVPLGRVEGLLEKIDALTDQGLHKKALKLIDRYVVQEAQVTATKEAAVIPVKLNRKEEIAALMARAGGMPVREKIAILQAQFEMSYNNARYYAMR